MMLELESMLAILGISFVIILFLVTLLLVAIALMYIYFSFAFMAIAKKAGDKLYGLAWIPLIGPTLIAFRASGMHWWPWILLAVGLLNPISMLPIPILSALSTFFDALLLLTFFVFAYIWTWKLFEKIGKPGWWALMPLIPLLGYLVYAVLVGIAAWKKD